MRSQDFSNYDKSWVIFLKLGNSKTVHYHYKNSAGKIISSESRIATTEIMQEGMIKILVSTDESKTCIYPNLIAEKNKWNN